jgi:hypothetical protein
MYAVPNGFMENVNKRRYAAEEGLKAGVFDVCVPYASNGYHGLYIEFKTPGRKLRDKQFQFMQYLHRANYKAAVVYGWQEALMTLKEYLEPLEP